MNAAGEGIYFSFFSYIFFFYLKVGNCVYVHILFIAYELYFDCMNENVLKNIVLSVGVAVYD